jgi:hypothetical protein
LGRDALCPYCRAVVKVPVSAEKPRTASAAADDDEPLMPPSFDAVTEHEAAPVISESPTNVGSDKKAPAPAEELWWAQTADGQQYGPVPKPELDSWVEDGSINAQCQVLRDGDQAWQWASQVYPQLL